MLQRYFCNQYRFKFFLYIQHMYTMIPYTTYPKVVCYCFIHHISITLVTPVRYPTITLNHLKTSNLPILHIYYTVIINVNIIGVLSVIIIIPPDIIMITYYSHSMISATSKTCKHILSSLWSSCRQSLVYGYIPGIE